MIQITAAGPRSGCRVQMPALQELLGFAARQFGLVTRRQILMLGFSESFITRQIAVGRLEVVRPRVYRVAGAPESWQQRVMSACLWGRGAVASHRTAAVMWELDGIRSTWVEITSRRKLDPTEPDVKAHFTNRLERVDVARCGPIPVTSVRRTLLDLGAVCPPIRAEIALDNAVARGLTSLPALQRYVDDVGGRGRRGAAVMRSILGPRLEAGGTPTNGGETKLFAALRKAGLPIPKMQYDVLDPNGRRVANVDFAYPDRRLAIELESWTYHSGKRRMDRDLDRRNDLTGVGWRVIWARNGDLERPAQIIRRIRRDFEHHP